MSHSRIRSLDGLRGIAAMVVCIHHSLLCTVDFSNNATFEYERSSLTWWLKWSPMHILWDGSAAVVIFFVLSGFVLSVDRVGHSQSQIRSGWSGYFPKRLVRLYVPVWIATVLAAVNIAIVNRKDQGLVSSWLSARSGVLSRRMFAEDFFLLNNPGISNSVLWSLKYEILFSLSLPLWVGFARKLKSPKTLIPPSIFLIFILAQGRGELTVIFYCMFIFFIGVILARNYEFNKTRIVAIMPTVSVTILMVLLLTFPWTRFGTGLSSSTDPMWIGIDSAAAAGGAGLAVWGCLYLIRWDFVFESDVIQWIGKRSFSLYLIHEPVVIAYSYLNRGHPSIIGMFVIAIPLCLLLANCFYLLVEKPSIKLARLFGNLFVNRKHI